MRLHTLRNSRPQALLIALTVMTIGLCGPLAAHAVTSTQTGVRATPLSGQDAPTNRLIIKYRSGGGGGSGHAASVLDDQAVGGRVLAREWRRAYACLR